MPTGGVSLSMLTLDPMRACVWHFVNEIGPSGAHIDNLWWMSGESIDGGRVLLVCKNRPAGATFSGRE